MKNYPQQRKHITELMNELGGHLPETMAAFRYLHRAGLEEGALPSKMKELIALAIGINVRCDGCIAYHVRDAMQAGASREEIVETIGVAIMMGGGPSVVYGCEAFEALKQFEEKGEVAG